MAQNPEASHHPKPDAGSLSVLLPFRDAEATLDLAVQSLVNQTHQAWDLLLLDDGSRDRSTNIAASWAARDKRIRHAILPARGIVPALNQGIKMAHGDLLMRMDGDDVAHPDRMAAQLAFMAAHPEVGVSGTGVRIVGGQSGFERYQDWINGLVTHDELVRELFVECPIPHPTFCMRRQAVLDLGGYRDGPWPEDYDLVFRFWREGWQLGKVPTVLLDWQDRPDRLSRRDIRYSPEAFRALKRIHLADTFLAGDQPLYQWGAGEVGKPWLREWTAPRPEAVVDIRPGKLGQHIHGFEVIPPDALPPPEGARIVVAVGTPGARDIIRDWFAARGYREGRDFLFIA